MDIVYLVHKMRGGKPLEVKAEVYNKNPMLFGGDGWRQATMKEIKDAGIELEEVKPVDKKLKPMEYKPIKKKATKKEVKED